MTDWLKTYPEELLKTRVNPDKWSAFENIVHLAAYQPMFAERIRSMLNDEKPSFNRYRADDDPRFFECLQMPPAELVRYIQENRQLIMDLVAGMKESQWKNWGLHSHYGQMELPAWIDFFLLHEAHHLFTAFMLIRFQLAQARK
jgi:hypothetical protein